MTNAEQIAHLRENGNKVYIHHRRIFRPVVLEQGEGYVVEERMLPRGGETIVEVITPDGQTLTGNAKCSLKDSFNKKMGLKIALGRAINGHGRTARTARG